VLAHVELWLVELKLALDRMPRGIMHLDVVRVSLQETLHVLAWSGHIRVNATTINGIVCVVDGIRDRLHVVGGNCLLHHLGIYTHVRQRHLMIGGIRIVV
jgi:hypothetical protein